MRRLTLRDRFALPLHDAIAFAAMFASLAVCAAIGSLS